MFFSNSSFCHTVFWLWKTYLTVKIKIIWQLPWIDLSIQHSSWVECSSPWISQQLLVNFDQIGFKLDPALNSAILWFWAKLQNHQSIFLVDLSQDLISFNPISYGGEGGGAQRPSLAELAIAPKRIYVLFWNFLTFLIYQKPKF